MQSALGLLAALLAVIGALMDAAENLTSFIMLSCPDAIPQALAVVYSGFAMVKFACITAAMAVLLASSAAGLIARLRK